MKKYNYSVNMIVNNHTESIQKSNFLNNLCYELQEKKYTDEDMQELLTVICDSYKNLLYKLIEEEDKGYDKQNKFKELIKKIDETNYLCNVILDFHAFATTQDIIDLFSDEDIKFLLS